MVVDESGELFVLFKEMDWKSKLLIKDTGRLRDTVIGDFDRTHPGFEALVVGSSGKVIQLYAEKGEWKTKVINQASEGL